MGQHCSRTRTSDFIRALPPISCVNGKLLTLSVPSIYKMEMMWRLLFIRNSEDHPHIISSPYVLKQRRQWHPTPVPGNSSFLSWKLPWMEEPRLQSMGSRRVRHDWATSLSLFTFMHWRRKWQPTPAFLPGESQGQRSLVGCRLWGRRESDTTEQLSSSSSMCLKREKSASLSGLPAYRGQGGGIQGKSRMWTWASGKIIHNSVRNVKHDTAALFVIVGDDK